ncbi:GxxExxY protein [Elizabethkingia anophelis]|nr:GxxExxY protein [Elizabethkingia anophelis]MDV3860436.1 GxxExxY protein [Elizabethkingia anophelis]MDV3907080.1 GxxExxY protein [Elizabethkingia anophelis]MDV3924072.1 GxxExxY protein [Elizabethkingia anophelis]MDV3987232.1 GxxExxY protein [Elizabethkingia anophelis]
MTKKDITMLSYNVLGCAIKVHKNLGPGLLESIYEKCLKYELERSGYDVKQQVLASIIYDDLCFDTELKLDLLVNNLICVELKTVDEIKPVHKAHLLSYMKTLQKPQGLLINFYTDNITK